MSTVNKIFMKLDETQDAKIGILVELERLNSAIDNMAGVYIEHHDFWLSESANSFWDSLQAWISETKGFKNTVQAYCERIDKERHEWMENDLAYKYSAEALEKADLTVSGETQFWATAGEKSSLDFKITLLELAGLLLPPGWVAGLFPAWTRYPEATTETTFRGLFGWVWEQDLPHEPWLFVDGGAYAGPGPTIWPPNLGVFGEFELRGATWHTAYNGIPFVFDLHGPSGEFKGGLGGEASLGLFGGDLGIPGLITFGLDAGVGAGATSDEIKLGPLTISADLPELWEVITGQKIWDTPEPSLGGEVW
jgi:hypothetical protein